MFFLVWNENIIVALDVWLQIFLTTILDILRSIIVQIIMILLMDVIKLNIILFKLDRHYRQPPFQVG